MLLLTALQVFAFVGCSLDLKTDPLSSEGNLKATPSPSPASTATPSPTASPAPSTSPSPSPTPSDVTPPTVALSASVNDPFSFSTFDVTVTFSEPVTGFTLSDVNVTNGTASSLSGSGASYTFTVTPAGQGLVTVAVGAGVAQDSAGNLNTAASNLTRNYDSTSLSVVIASTATASTNVSPIPFTVIFSKNVTGFDASDVTVGNGTVSGFSGSGSTYTFNVTPTAQGAVTVDIGAGVAQDAASSGNTAAVQVTRVYDSVQPTVALASGASDPFSTSSFTVTATFSESVTGFASSDVVVSNGTVASFSGSGTTYTFNVTPSSQGAVTVDVSSGVAQDAAGNDNTAASTLTRTYDSTAPTVIITSSAGSTTNQSPIPFTITFSKSVTGFDSSDVTVGNGTITGFSGTGTTYTMNVTPTLEGAVTVDINASVAQDAAGNGNASATQFTRTYDTVQPTLSLSSAAASTFSSANFSVTATFSESVTGFTLGDITVTNGIASSLSGSGASYSFTVTPSGEGLVTIGVGSSVAQDAAGNDNLAASNLTRTYDSTQPTLTLSTAAGDPLSSASFTVTATFSEAVTGFALSDINVTNGAASSLSGSGASYTFTVSPSAQGTVTVAVGAGLVQDAAGNDNIAATNLTRTYDSTAPTVSISSSAGSSTNVSPIPFTITFSESVTGFDSSDVTVGNGTITGFSGTGTTFTMNVTPTLEGAVTVDINASVAQDAAGNGNAGATQFTRTYDTVQPTLLLSSAAASTFGSSNFSVTATFSESVTNFALGDITVTNGTASSLSGSGASYSFTVTPSGQGLVTVAVAANVAQDTAGNDNTAATNLTRTYDSVAPSVTSFTAPSSTIGNFTASLTLFESVADLTQSDFSVSNGTIASFSGSGTSYSVTVTPTSTGTVTLTLGANSISDAVGNTGPSSSASVSVSYAPPSWAQQAYLKAANAEANDVFGMSVGVSGDTIVVGANGEDSNQTTITNGTTASANNSALGAGAAYVFRRSGSTWVAEAYLKASNAEASDSFGRAVAISLDTIAVSAPGEASNQTTITNGSSASSDNSASSAGAVYVFRRTGSTWAQEAYLKAPNAEAGDNFGYQALAISGDTIIVGAYQEDSNQTTISNGTDASVSNSTASSGAAYVFRRTGTNWVNEAYLKAPNPDVSDNFGTSVAVSGDTVVVGASNEASNQTTITNGSTASSNNSNSASGAAYVFRRTGSTWAQEAYLKAPNSEASDTFGTSVAVSGDTVLVGAPAEDSNQTTVTNGTTGSTDNSLSNSGAAYAFHRTGATWTMEAYLKAPNAGANDSFGQVVALSGDLAVVGALYEDSNQTTVTNATTITSNDLASNAGAVYVFRRTGTTWVHEAYIKAPNAEANDTFGNSVGISGNTIVIGAVNESSNQTTVSNGTTASSNNSASAAGAAYAFQFSAPSATLAAAGGLPTTVVGPGSTSLSLTIGGTGVVSYRYKIGLAGSTDCSSASGYSSDIAVGTPLSYDLSTFAENSSVTLCVVGVDASGTVQSYSSATSHTWTTKDTVAPTAPSNLAVNTTYFDYTSVSPVISWTAGSDSSLYGYQVALGSTSGATDVLSWRFVGNVTSTQLKNLSLSLDTAYFISVRAVDLAGNVSSSATGVSWTTSCAGSIWCNQAYVKAPNPDANDSFGVAVAVNGDTMVVGDQFEDSSQTTITNGTTASSDNSAADAGAVFVYRRAGSTWAQEAYLKASNAGAGDYFGASVAVSGDLIVVGAYSEDSSQTIITNGSSASSDNSANSSGATYVFRRTGSTWAQEAYLKASNTDPGDSFGQVVAVSGDTIVVGARFEYSTQTTITNGSLPLGDNTAAYVGAVYVFRRVGTLWQQEAYLKASNAEFNDYFGYSVAVSGDTIAVGATQESSNQSTITNGTSASSNNSASYSGAVYVYRRTGSNWAQEAYLKAPNVQSSDYFGKAVAISGNTIVVGVQNEDSNQTTITNGTTASSNDSTSDAGAAYVFRRSGSNWAQEAYLKASNAEANDNFGISVGVSGDLIVVGAHGEASSQNFISLGATAASDNTAASAGAAYVFRRTGTTWAQEAYLKAPNAEMNDLFGANVAVSGDTIVAGAIGEDSSQSSITNGITASSNNSVSGAGAVYVFKYGSPYATLSSAGGLPSTTVNSGNTSLSLTIGGTGVVSYRYKIGLAGSTDCSSASGYSADIPIGTPLTYDLSTFAENSSITLCVVGVDASNNVQSYSNATSHTWLVKDTVDPSAPTNVAVSSAYYYYTNFSPTITWTASSDSNLYGYQVAIGSTSGATDALSWRYVGNATSAQLRNLNLSLNTTYYVSVRAIDLAGNLSTVATGASWTTSCVGAMWCNQAYLKAPNADQSDAFGSSVAISGDTIVVGTTAEDSTQTTITNGTTASSNNGSGVNTNSGAAYVFRRTGINWAQEAYLKPSNVESMDYFGGSVAVSGDIVVVGAFGEDSNQTTVTNGATASADNSASGAGAVYVFRRTGTNWAQEAYLKAPNADINDNFGYKVAVSGDTVVVGAYTEDSNQTTITNGTSASADNSVASSGAAYVFRRTGTTWAQEAYLKAPNPDSGDSFGMAVAVSGDTVVVGAQNESSNQTTITNGTTASTNNSASGSGAAYVFRRTGTNWAQEAYLKAPNAEASDSFGASVAVSGDTVVVGANGEDSNQTTITNGTTATTNNSTSGSGAAYVFRRTGTTWAQEAYLKASNAEANDSFGISVSVSGDLILVGASGEDSNQTVISSGTSASADNSASASGAAYVFRRTGTTWAQEAYLKAPNAELNDSFGNGLMMSGDSLVVGASSEASNQTTITNGPTASSNNALSGAGAAYVYNYGAGTDAKTVAATQVEYNPVGGETVSVAVQYSDDSSTWTTAGTTTLSSSGTRTYRLAFNPVGSHRYWRIAFADTGDSCITGAVEIAEANLYLLNDSAVDLASKSLTSSDFANTSNATDGSSATSAVFAGTCSGVIGWDFGP